MLVFSRQQNKGDTNLLDKLCSMRTTIDVDFAKNALLRYVNIKYVFELYEFTHLKVTYL